MELSDEEKKTLETYEKIAQWRAWAYASSDFRRANFEEFQKKLPAGGVIDLGCGSGRYAKLFIEAGYDYTGVDLSPRMIEEARRRVPHTTFLEMNMYQMNFPNSYFDGFWASASLHHIPKNKIQNVLGEIRRIVKLNGVGFIAVREGEGERILQGRFGKDDQRFSAFYQEEEFANTLENSGFGVLKCSFDVREYFTTRNKNIWLLYFVIARTNI